MAFGWKQLNLESEPTKYGFNTDLRWIICMKMADMDFTYQIPQLDRIQSTLWGQLEKKGHSRREGTGYRLGLFEGWVLVQSTPFWMVSCLSGVSHSRVSEEVPGSRCSCACGSRWGVLNLIEAIQTCWFLSPRIRDTFPGLKQRNQELSHRSSPIFIISNDGMTAMT